MPHRKSTRRVFWLILVTQATVGSAVAHGVVVVSQNTGGIVGESTGITVGLVLAAGGAMVMLAWRMGVWMERTNARQAAHDVTDAQQASELNAQKGRLDAHDETLAKHHQRIAALEARSTP